MDSPGTAPPGTPLRPPTTRRSARSTCCRRRSTRPQEWQRTLAPDDAPVGPNGPGPEQPSGPRQQSESLFSGALTRRQQLLIEPLVERAARQRGTACLLDVGPHRRSEPPTLFSAARQNQCPDQGDHIQHPRSLLHLQPPCGQRDGRSCDQGIRGAIGRKAARINAGQVSLVRHLSLNRQSIVEDVCQANRPGSGVFHH